ncbi:MAG: C45 family autoproteolytic acyltransferase/hydrolase [Gemmataceae bacterium]|nr:C45 family autoproteolytic acyltransferase/hydrolase [Gemmataceae bacterium]
MLPWIERPTLAIDLALPPEGRYAHIPPEAVSAGKTLLTAIMREIPASAKLLADLVRLRTANRFHAEIVGLARHVGVDWRDIMLANISYDLLLSSLGCSTVALPTPRGPVLARNMDWWPEDLLARASYLVQCRRGNDVLFTNAGWPGSVGIVSGLSPRGFALVLNAALSPDPPSKLGYPVLLHLRRVLEDAGGFEEAVRMATDTHLAVGGLITVVGVDNAQRVVIERTPRRHALRWPKGDEPLVATNDYRLLARTESRDELETCRTTCARYDACREFFAGHAADRDVDDHELLYRLSDPRVIQTITAQHVIFRPRERSARLLVPRRLVEQT